MWFVRKLVVILKKKFLHQTAFVIAGSVVNGASLLAINIILARSLSQDFFGIFSLAILALSTMGEVSDFGLNLSFLRFGSYYLVTNQLDKLKQLVKTVWYWRVVLSVVLTVGGIVLAKPIALYIFSQRQIVPYLALSFMGVGGVVLLGFLVTFLQASQKFLSQSIIQSLKGLLRLIGIALLAIFGVSNLFAYLAVYISIPWILVLFNYRVLPKDFKQVVLEPEVKSKIHAQLTRFSFWFTVASLIAIVSGKIDQVIVSHYLGLQNVAIFSVAWQLIQILPVIYNSINSVLLPKAGALTSKVEMALFLKRSLKWTVAGFLGMAVLIYPSQYLVSFLFGAQYEGAVSVYLVLAYGHILNLIIVPFSLVINIFNKIYLNAVSAILHLIINVVCAVIFIPSRGIMGVVYAFIFSMIFSLVWNISASIYLLKYKDLIIEK